MVLKVALTCGTDPAVNAHLCQISTPPEGSTLLYVMLSYVFMCTLTLCFFSVPCAGRKMYDERKISIHYEIETGLVYTISSCLCWMLCHNNIHRLGYLGVDGEGGAKLLAFGGILGEGRIPDMSSFFYTEPEVPA